MSTEHKEALAAGRAAGNAVKRYLEALESTKPKRGRRPSKDSMKQQLAEVESRLVDADVLQRLHLIQQRKTIEARMSHGEVDVVDLAPLEEEFINVAADYSARKGISYSTWREAGVPAEVLRRAGITRTLG